MSYTVTITNTRQNPYVLNGAVDLTTISPTGITTPQTPYTEYVADSQTITDGSVIVPLYGKVQYCVLPSGKTLTLTTDDSNAAVYYSQLTVDGATVTVVTDPIADTASDDGGEG